ncbi:HIR complex subunit [Microsporum audouinii]
MRLLTLYAPEWTDGYVRIWSTEAIYNSGDPAYEDKPKQLASMSNHSGTIHTVRFSPNGKYLASGADDKIVCVYTQEANVTAHATFGSNEPPPVENWRTIRRLIGHDNDIQDLGWSYDSSILVSVGLDSKVVVWSGHTFEKLKTLLNHQSHVKGITFDPANKYFATASDDRTVRIFRFNSPLPNSTAHDQTHNFVHEKTVKSPFVNSPLTTYFRRCSWSPDGNHIAAANAVNGPVSAVAIINRGSWESDINLIGHEAPVEVCAFAPRLYSTQPIQKPMLDSHGNAVHNLVTVIACAGGDKSLSIWITSNPRPIVIAQDISVKAISDLAWSPDGNNLFATALDGAIIAVRFETAELGHPMPIEENEKSLSKFGTNRRGAGMVESTDGLLLEEKSKAGELRGVKGRMGALMGDSHTDADNAVNGEADATATTTTPQKATQSEKVAQSGVTNGADSSQAKQDPYAVKLDRLKQRPTYTKEGKKRIAPLLVSGAVGTQSSLPQTKLVAASMNTQGTSEGPQSVLDLSKPFDGLPKGGLAALLFGNRRKFSQLGDDEDGSAEKRIATARDNGVIPILSNTPDGLVPAVPTPSEPQETPSFIRPAVVNPCMAVSQLRLAVPKIRSHILQGIDSFGNPKDVSGNTDSTKARVDIVFEARNPSQASLTGRSADKEPVRISLNRGDQPLWQDYLPKAVILVTGNKKLWAAASEDGSIYIWTPAGRRLLNALVLESQAVVLECMESWVLCITAVGMCYVWNISTLSSPHPPISLQPVLDAALHTMTGHATAVPSIVASRISSEGRIIVGLSTGDGYSYSPSLYTWQRLSEPWWAVASQYWNSTEAPVGNLQVRGQAEGESAAPVSAGIVPFLERNTTQEVLARGRGHFLQRLIKILLSREGFESFEASASIAHLENRVAATLSLAAKEEFRMYLSMYAKRLGAEGAKLKAEELLEDILGGVFEDKAAEEEQAKQNRQPGQPEQRSWLNESDTLCGWPRRTLLKDVILAFGKHRDLQRVTVPYAQLLGILDESQDDDDTMAVGLANVGKSTLFQAITKSTLGNPANFPFATIDPEQARVIVPDERYDWLCKHYKPKSEVPANLTVYDIAGLTRGASTGAGLGNAFLSHIRAVDAIFQVVRCFDDAEIVHVEGDVDPVRDLNIISEELRIKDIEFVEKALDALSKQTRRGGQSLEMKKLKEEEEIVAKVLAFLKDGNDIRKGDWGPKEVDVINPLFLLTAKPVVYLVNLSEKDYIRQKNKYIPKVAEWIKTNSPGDPIIPLSVSFEERLTQFGDDAAAAAECEKLGTKSALPKIIVTMRQSLNLGSFFTTGADEVRQWTIRKGTKAPQAAGVIHTDFEKTFIQCLVFNFDVLKECGDEAAVRAAGKVLTKGKDYVIEDGDIVLIKAGAAKA